MRSSILFLVMSLISKIIENFGERVILLNGPRVVLRRAQYETGFVKKDCNEMKLIDEIPLTQCNDTIKAIAWTIMMCIQSITRLSRNSNFGCL